MEAGISGADDIVSLCPRASLVHSVYFLCILSWGTNLLESDRYVAFGKWILSSILHVKMYRKLVDRSGRIPFRFSTPSQILKNLVLTWIYVHRGEVVDFSGNWFTIVITISEQWRLTLDTLPCQTIKIYIRVLVVERKILVASSFSFLSLTNHSRLDQIPFKTE